MLATQTGTCHLSSAASAKLDHLLQLSHLNERCALPPPTLKRSSNRTTHTNTLACVTNVSFVAGSGCAVLSVVHVSSALQEWAGIHASSGSHNVQRPAPATKDERCSSTSGSV
eukprot:3392364-Amphidinium_carterae.1